MISDVDLQVREVALKVLAEAARVAVRSNLADEYLSLAASVNFIDLEERRALRSALEQVIQYEAGVLSEGQREAFKNVSGQMAGQSFHDRLRRYFGERTHGDKVDYRLGYEEQQRIYLEQAEAVAEEALTQPELLIAEWQWLFSQSAKNSYYFGWALGRKDTSMQWWEYLQERAITEGQGYALTSAYLRGQLEANRLKRDNVLRSWMKRGASAAPLCFDFIWRGELSESDGERIAEMIEQGWINDAAVGSLYLGSAFTKLSVGLATRLIGLALESGTAAGLDAALSLLHIRMEKGDEEREALNALAWKALESLGALWGQGGDTMSGYYAGQIGSMMAAQNPARAARAVLAIYDNANAPVGPDEILDILTKATEHDPSAVWDLVAKRIYPDGGQDLMNSYRLRLALEKWYVQLIPPYVLLGWAAGNLPEGPVHIAELSDVQGNPMDELPRGLLIRFGADEAVRTALLSQFTTGSWSGSMSNWLRQKLELAERWSGDAETNVQRWAEEARDYIKLRLESAELEEVERGY